MKGRSNLITNSLMSSAQIPVCAVNHGSYLSSRKHKFIWISSCCTPPQKKKKTHAHTCLAQVVRLVIRYSEVLSLGVGVGWFACARVHYNQTNSLQLHRKFFGVNGRCVFTFTYSLAARVAGAPQMTSLPVSSIFLFSTALWTWQTPGLSIP